jgi:hypothetical protein
VFHECLKTNPQVLVFSIRECKIARAPRRIALDRLAVHLAKLGQKVRGGREPSILPLELRDARGSPHCRHDIRE